MGGEIRDGLREVARFGGLCRLGPRRRVERAGLDRLRRARGPCCSDSGAARSCCAASASVGSRSSSVDLRAQVLQDADFVLQRSNQFFFRQSHCFLKRRNEIGANVAGARASARRVAQATKAPPRHDSETPGRLQSGRVGGSTRPTPDIPTSEAGETHDRADARSVPTRTSRPRDLSRRDFVAMGLAAGVVAAAVPASAAVPVVETMVEIKTPDGTCDAAFIHPTTGSHPAVIDLGGRLRPAPGVARDGQAPCRRRVLGARPQPVLPRREGPVLLDTANFNFHDRSAPSSRR